MCTKKAYVLVHWHLHNLNKQENSRGRGMCVNLRNKITLFIFNNKNALNGYLICNIQLLGGFYPNDFWLAQFF